MIVLKAVGKVILGEYVAGPEVAASRKLMHFTASESFATS